MEDINLEVIMKSIIFIFSIIGFFLYLLVFGANINIPEEYKKEEDIEQFEYLKRKGGEVDNDRRNKKRIHIFSRFRRINRK